MTELNLTTAAQPALQAIAESRDAVRWATSALLGLGAVQVVIVMFTMWRLREIGRLRERLSRLADGLALLTDTTENGFTEIARQIEELGRKPAASRAASRGTVNKRVVTAAKQGDQVASIARTEALSESEVRLHLALAEKALVEKAPRRGRPPVQMPGPGPSGL
jgi:hypothetical protein